MSDVTDAPPRAAANEDARGSAQGSYIWYELMTPDPEGAKAFYEAVVRLDDRRARRPASIDYRMIGRSDGGNAGGVLRLSDEMRAARRQAGLARLYRRRRRRCDGRADRGGGRQGA